MRIKLEPNYQKQLFLEAKGNGTWKELGCTYGITASRVYSYAVELRTLPLGLYDKLKTFDSDQFILEKLDDRWAQLKGAATVRNKISIPKFSEELAEIVGIMLGDGCLSFESQWQCCQLAIAFNSKNERPYAQFVYNSLKKLFGITPHWKFMTKANCMYLCISSKTLGEFFESIGVFRSSIKQKTGVPQWIKDNPNFYAPCIRGLIDTDGSIYRLSRRDAHLLRITFKSANVCFSTDLRNMLLKLGFHPSKLTNRQIHLTRKADILKYMREIGFNNLKNTQRYYEFSSSPFV